MPEREKADLLHAGNLLLCGFICDLKGNSWRKAVVEVWMLDLAGSRWPDLVQILMDWIEHCRASDRLMRRHTPLRRMVASAARAQPLRFVQRQQIVLDHFGSGISCDQTCKWGIEWDACALQLRSYKE